MAFFNMIQHARTKWNLYKSRRFLLGVTEIVQTMFLYFLRVDYVTQDQSSTGNVCCRFSTELNSPNASRTGLQVPQALPAVKLNVLPLGEAWKGENQFSTEPTTGICRSSPCKAQPNRWEVAPRGTSYLKVPKGCCLWPHLFQQSFFICFLKLKLCFLYPFSNNFSHVFQQLIKPRNKDIYYLDLKLSF